MNPVMIISVVLQALIVLPPRDGQGGGSAPPRMLHVPAGENAAQASLATSPDGRTILSWIEGAGEGSHTLRFSVLEETAWSAPRTIAGGDDWFVNWADFPSVAALPGGSMAAHWLRVSGAGTYAYDVMIARSNDGGTTWSPGMTPHHDGTETEHGFVSMFPDSGGSIGAVWLDGRAMAGSGDGHGGEGHGSHGDMALRYASLPAAGGTAGDTVLDERVCECCQTSAAMTSEGPVVVYRDRLAGEVRDISIVRRAGGAWKAPKVVHSDGWKIDGCPVNGPAVDAYGRTVVVAWFTAAGGTPRVKLAFSRDAGGSFGPPVIVDDGSPAGRVDVVILGDSGAAVSWLERTGGSGEIRVRRVGVDGKAHPSVTVAPSGTARSNGFPRMAGSGGRLVLAWPGDGVRSAVIPAP